MINNRQSFRLHKQLDVAWSIPDQKMGGEGKILNISREGMLFTTDKLFLPEHGLVIGFKVAQIPAFPSKGHLIWFSRKLGEEGAYYRCGVKFLYEETLRPAWVQWMEDNILKLADAVDGRILSRYLTTED
jgi:PilZ domain